MSKLNDYPIKEFSLFRLLESDLDNLCYFNRGFLGSQNIGIFHAIGIEPETGDTLYIKPHKDESIDIIGIVIGESLHKKGTVKILASFRLYNN